MKTLLTLFVLFVSSPLFASDYSLFYEEDGKAIMIIYYDDNKLFGEIIQFGGYKWFRKTYSNQSNETVSFIQPSNLGVSGDMKSWMLERYEIDEIEYFFKKTNNDQILTFYSSEAIQAIIGYISTNKSFSFATLSKDAWYAGTFIPIKDKENLISLSKINERTFCQVLNTVKNIKGKNIQLKVNDITKLMSLNSLVCDENFNLF